MRVTRFQTNVRVTFSTGQAGQFLRLDLFEVVRRFDQGLFGPDGSVLIRGGKRRRITEKGLVHTLTQRRGWTLELAEQAILAYKRSGALPAIRSPDDDGDCPKKATTDEVHFTTGQVARFVCLAPRTVGTLFDNGEFGPKGGYITGNTEDRRITPQGFIYLLLQMDWKKAAAESAVAEYARYVSNTIFLVEQSDAALTAWCKEQLLSLGYTCEIVGSNFVAGVRAAGLHHRSVAMVSQGRLEVYQRLLKSPYRANFDKADPFSIFEAAQVYHPPDDLLQRATEQPLRSSDDPIRRMKAQLESVPT